MSIQTISLIFINSASTIIFLKYAIQHLYQHILKEKDEKILWLLSKINKLEYEINELHETIDSLEEKIQAKETLLKESSDILFNKIDNFIIGNYDTVNKNDDEDSINKHPFN